MATPTEETYQLLQRALEELNRGLFEGQLPRCLITLQRKPRTGAYYSAERFGNLDGERVDEIALNPTVLPQVSPLYVLSMIARELVHQWQRHFGTPSRPGYHNHEWAAKMLEIGLMPSSTSKPGGKQVGQRVGHYILPQGKFMEVATNILRGSAFQVPWLDRYLPGGKAAQDHPASGSKAPAANPEDQSSGVEGAKAGASSPPHGMGDAGVPGTNENAPASFEYVDEELGMRAPPGSLSAPTTAGFRPVPDPRPTSRSKKTDASNRTKYTCGTCGINVWGKPGLQVQCMQCERPLRSTGSRATGTATAVSRSKAPA